MVQLGSFIALYVPSICSGPGVWVQQRPLPTANLSVNYVVLTPTLLLDTAVLVCNHILQQFIHPTHSSLGQYQWPIYLRPQSWSQQPSIFGLAASPNQNLFDLAHSISDIKTVTSLFDSTLSCHCQQFIFILRMSDSRIGGQQRWKTHSGGQVGLNAHIVEDLDMFWTHVVSLTSLSSTILIF